MSQIVEIPCILNDGHGASKFSNKEYQLAGLSERRLSEQIPAVNFRLRSSDASYSSDWHVAGDPTLLIILAGSVKIELRNGQYRQFDTGQMFVAEDFLFEDVSFDDVCHGHRAKVVGGEELSVLHLKLALRELSASKSQRGNELAEDKWEI